MPESEDRDGVVVERKGGRGADRQTQRAKLTVADAQGGFEGAVDTDNLPGAAAALFHYRLFARPDAPERRQFFLWRFALQFIMFRDAKNGIGECLPVIARSNHFDIAAHFAFVAHQQGDVIAAMAQVEPEGICIDKCGFSLLAKNDFRQRRG